MWFHVHCETGINTSKKHATYIFKSDLKNEGKVYNKSTKLHGVTSQNTLTLILLRASNVFIAQIQLVQEPC